MLLTFLLSLVAQAVLHELLGVHDANTGDEAPQLEEVAVVGDDEVRVGVLCQRNQASVFVVYFSTSLLPEGIGDETPQVVVGVGLVRVEVVGVPTGHLRLLGDPGVEVNCGSRSPAITLLANRLSEPVLNVVVDVLVGDQRVLSTVEKHVDSHTRDGSHTLHASFKCNEVLVPPCYFVLASGRVDEDVDVEDDILFG